MSRCWQCRVSGDAASLLRGFVVARVVLWSHGGACFVVSNVVFSLMLQRFCVVLVLLVLCYDRPAVHASMLAMSCFR